MISETVVHAIDTAVVRASLTKNIGVFVRVVNEDRAFIRVETVSSDLRAEEIVGCAGGVGGRGGGGNYGVCARGYA